MCYKTQSVLSLTPHQYKFQKKKGFEQTRPSLGHHSEAALNLKVKICS